MSSRKRRLVTPQQPDEKRRTDRIVVDVGGTLHDERVDVDEWK